MANTDSELVRIRLLNPTLAGLNGVFGNYSFTDGVSEQMLRREAERLSVITAVEFLDVENLWERKSRERGLVRSDNLNVSQTAKQGVSEVKPKKSSTGIEKSVTTYSREQLEAIADAKGIQGLREIAEPLGVKAVSIRTLIDGILSEQKKG